MINYLNSLGKKSQDAFKNMIDNKTKNKVLDKFVFLIEKEKKLITKENNKDINLAVKKKLKENLIDRLLLNSVKLKGIQSAIRNISKLKDPIDVTLHKWRRPNGCLLYTSDAADE